MDKKILTNLSLMRRARKLMMGYDQTAESIGRGCTLVLFAKDISPKTKERMLALTNKMNVRTRDLDFTIAEIDFVVGKPIAVMGITDKGFSDNLLSLLTTN